MILFLLGVVFFAGLGPVELAAAATPVNISSDADNVSDAGANCGSTSDLDLDLDIDMNDVDLAQPEENPVHLDSSDPDDQPLWQFDWQHQLTLFQTQKYVRGTYY